MSKARIAALVASGLVAGSVGVTELISRWETGGKPQAFYTVYADRLANGLPTVCDGITHHVTDTPIIVGEVWPASKCILEERRALIEVQGDLFACFRKIPPQAVFDAATSHAWNVGAPSTCGSAAMQAWNRGDWTLGCKRLQQADSGKLVWVYADGKFVQGLANRRADERRYCETMTIKIDFGNVVSGVQSTARFYP